MPGPRATKASAMWAPPVNVPLSMTNQALSTAPGAPADASGVRAPTPAPAAGLPAKPTIPAATMRKGGKVKSKGCGCATKGHTKGKMR